MKNWARIETRIQAGREWAVYSPVDKRRSAEAILDSETMQGFSEGEAEKLFQELFRAVTSGPSQETTFQKKGQPQAPVSGRGTIQRYQSPGGPPIVIRRAIRGGVLRGLLGTRYFRFFRSRARVYDELFLTTYLRNKGVLVPRPFGALVYCPWIPFMYSAIFVTEEIPQAKNLLEMFQAGTAEEDLSVFAERAGYQAGEMLKSGVFHPDLHLANILISGEAAYLIDFDKAELLRRESEQDFENLSRRLVSRFRRFAEKYNAAPQVLSDAFERGVLRSGEKQGGES